MSEKYIGKVNEAYKYASSISASSGLEDIKALQELEGEFSADELSRYILLVRKDKIRQREAQKEKERECPRPFQSTSTPRLWELTEHWHPDIAYGAKIELARLSFYYFCHLKAPKFYNTDRPYIVRLCNELQAFYESDETVMIINLPPRHGKSRTAGLFEQWVYGQEKSEKIITGSYNETLSTGFSKSVRNGIDEEKGDPDVIVYSDIFPDVRIQRGDAAMNIWSLEGQYASYLATSPDGTVTGFGGSLIVIDDLVKKALEAFNENLLEAHWKWFTDTIMSRREIGGKFIIIMTRWASGDLAGRAEKHFKSENIPCRVLSMKAVVNEETHEMLCPEILSYNDYLLVSKAMSQEIASANYQQVPIDLKGRLYQSFKTYKSIPYGPDGKPLFTAIRAYCDTADQGNDYLCNIIYGVYQNYAYVLDVYYTKDGMEITEKETARRLCEFKVQEADIESNNGGRGFARNVLRILREIFKFLGCIVSWFHQSENKRARILTGSTFVQNNILFPEGWESLWPGYHEAMFKYQKEGKNANDDAPDATTGVAEHYTKSSIVFVVLGAAEEYDPAEVNETESEKPSPILKSFFKRTLGRLSDRRSDKWF